MKKINKNCDCACVVTDSKNNSEVRFFPYRSSGKVVGGMVICHSCFQKEIKDQKKKLKQKEFEGVGSHCVLPEWNDLSIVVNEQNSHILETQF